MASDLSAERPRGLTRQPVLGMLWKQLQQLAHRIDEHRVMLIAAGVTYYLLLALVPALTLFVALYGLFNDRSTVAAQVDRLVGIVPADALDIVRDQLTRLTSAPPAALSVALIISLLVSLWSASSAIKALFDAMNIAYDETEKRNFLVLNGLALLFTLCGVVTALVAVGAVVVIPAVLDSFHLADGYAGWVAVPGYLVMLAVLVAAVGALYRWGPSEHHGHAHWLSPGTALTVAATAVVSIVFSWYAANFGHYNATYGSLGALVGLLTWLWLTIIVIIVGAELNAAQETAAPHRDPVTTTVTPMAASQPSPLFLLAGVVLLAALAGPRHR